MDKRDKQEVKDEKQLQDTLADMDEKAAEQDQEELVRKNKLGTMAEWPLLINMSLPIVISMLVQAFYNVVDSIFLSRMPGVGEDALAAVGFVFPIQNLMIAVAVGTGVGVSSLLGRRLGEQNVESANRAAMNGLFLALLSWAAFALVGLFGSAPFMASFGSNAQITTWGVEYMQIVTIGSLGVFMSVMLERLLQSTGRSVYSMVSQLTGAVINIILDPIMIFGLLGFPAMGVAGAALATIIGQFGSLFISLWLNLFKNHEIRIRFRGFRPSAKTIKHIYQVGLPSIVMQSIGSLMTFFVNKILVGFGTTPVSVFSVYFKLQSFVFMPVIGVNNGMVPIVAFNYGAKKRSRIEKTVKLCVLVNLCMMVAGTALFLLAPNLLMGMFDATDNMLAIGVPALRIISLGFPLAAVSIALTGVFQALGQGVYSLLMSAIRQLLVLLPVFWVLSRLVGLPQMWYAFPVAELVCTVCAVWFFRRVWENRIRPLGAA